MSTTKKNQHFTAVITINDVAVVEDREAYTSNTSIRTVDRDVVRLVLRAPTLESLKAKVLAHVQLIDDDEEK